MKVLYRFNWNCGRMGDLEGLFVADEGAVTASIGREVNFGEVLGKHSEIYGELEEKDFTEVSRDQEKIEWLAEVVGSTTISGYNPLEYLEDAEEEADEEDET